MFCTPEKMAAFLFAGLPLLKKDGSNALFDPP